MKISNRIKSLDAVGGAQVAPPTGCNLCRVSDEPIASMQAIAAKLGCAMDTAQEALEAMRANRAKSWLE